MLKWTLFKHHFIKMDKISFSILLSKENVQSQNQYLLRTGFDFVRRKTPYFVQGDTDQLNHSCPRFSGTGTKAC